MKETGAHVGTLETPYGGLTVRWSCWVDEEGAVEEEVVLFVDDDSMMKKLRVVDTAGFDHRLEAK